jgi:hypothetical protein
MAAAVARPDIYNVDFSKPAAWKLDGTLLGFKDGNGDILATGCNLTYGRQITTSYPINTNKRIIVAGSPKGNVTIESIIGPVGDVQEFLANYGNVCEVGNNTMTLNPGGITQCDAKDFKDEKFSSKPVIFVLSNCLMTNYGINIQNQNGLGMVTSQITMEFTHLEIKDAPKKA